MFAKLAKFEFNYFRKQPSFYVTAFIFFLLTFFAMISSNVQIGVSGANINYNSPQAITQMMIIMTLIGMFLVANFVGGTATREYSYKMDGIMHSLPISKTSYLWARLLGSMGFCLLVYMAVPLGNLIGSLWPTVDAERLGATALSPYFWALIIFVIPNFIFTSALFYSFAMFTRTMMGMYLGVIGFFILYSISRQIVSDPSMAYLGAMLDPFGLQAFNEVTRYWTPFEMNNQSVPFEGYVLQNRVLWLTISAVIITMAHYVIDYRKPKNIKATKQKQTNNQDFNKKILTISPSDSRRSQWLRFKKRVVFEIFQIIKSPAFVILGILTAFSLTSIFISNDGSFGTSNWPLTRNMASYIMGTFDLMILIIITYYAAEAVWRERQLGVGDIVDSTATANWALYFPKVLALCLVMIILLSIGISFTVLYQAGQGHTNFEPGVYFSILFINALIPFIMSCILSVFIQILSPNKYFGMLLFVLYIILSVVLYNLGLEHNLWHFSSSPNAVYSDLNNYGFASTPTLLYTLYWTGFTTILVVLGYGMYARGSEYGIKHRFSLLRMNLGWTGISTMMAGIVLFVGMGSYIYYQTRVLNKFISEEELLQQQAAYEKSYKQYQNMVLPKITDVNLNVDIYPYQRKLEANGYYLIENKSAEDINKVLVNWDLRSDVNISMVDASLEDFSKEFNTGWLRFDPVLKPGESRKLEYNIHRQAKGFVDKNADTTIVANGSFINSFTLLPHFGYNDGFEISDRQERKKRDLSPPQRLPKLEDSSHYKTSFLGKEADFINYEAIVSTAADQVALTPGYLQKQWQEGDRKYFHYKMNAPIFNFIAFLSGKYEIAKEVHKGINIEVYHHPDHDKNVQRMIDATKESLDYFNDVFSPYQHQQVRIIEFPRYASFAQSFSNTIPYSEDIGFIADLRDEEDIDYVTFVTAHEMGHQWWGHQVMPANVQGSAVLSESLSEYSAYLVMEKILGEHQLRKFLKWEMDRYLIGRSREILQELPLMKAENQQYIHYQKGGIVMYSLKDRLGEDKFNLALRNFLNEFQYQSNPYPTTLDLVKHIKSVASENDYEFIDDVMARITLFDLKTKSATAKKLDNGNYKVKLAISADKYYADGKGEETKAKLNDLFDIGIFSMNPDNSKASDHVLYFEKKRIHSGENILTFEVKELPKFAGIDPYIKMIDRNSDDNLIAVDLIK